jgi:hypothetical protein
VIIRLEGTERSQRRASVYNSKTLDRGVSPHVSCHQTHIQGVRYEAALMKRWEAQEDIQLRTQIIRSVSNGPTDSFLQPQSGSILRSNRKTDKFPASIQCDGDALQLAFIDTGIQGFLQGNTQPGVLNTLDEGFIIQPGPLHNGLNTD